MRYPIPVQGLTLSTPNPAVFVRVDADGETVIFTVTATPFESATEFAAIDGETPWLFDGPANRWAHRPRGGSLFLFGHFLPVQWS
jgi:hypothetical protein